MTAGFAFGGFDTCRDFGLVDIVVFLAVGTDDRKQRTDDRGQKTEDRIQRTDGRGQKTVNFDLGFTRFRISG